MKVARLMFSVAAPLLGLLLACGKLDSTGNSDADRCSTTGTVRGIQAADEFDAMVKSVRIGNRCELVSNGKNQPYELRLADGQVLAMTIVGTEEVQNTKLVAERQQCGGVPYWFVSSDAFAINDSPANLFWSVRLDSNETSDFRLLSSDKKTSVALANCRLRTPRPLRTPRFPLHP